MSKSVRPGRGAFQWNAGGWFGSQVGATLWLGILGTILAVQGSLAAGMLGLGGFFLANAVGTGLWLRRDRVAPYPAIQILIGTIGFFSVATLLGLRFLGLETLPGTPNQSNVGTMLLLILMFPGLMLWFALLERAALRRKR